MNQMQNDIITKDSIVDYVDNMKIKKTKIGGYDKVDVFVHIQELLKMYGAFSEQELNRQKDTLEEQQKEIQMLESARKKLDSRNAANEEKEAEIKKLREQITDLMHYKDMVDSLQGENRAQSKRIEALAKSEELGKTLKKENEVLNHEIESKRIQIKEANEELEMYKINTITLEKQIEIQKSEIEELTVYKDQIMTRLKEDREGLRQIDVFSVDLQEELESHKSKILELKAELQNKTDEVLKLKAELQNRSDDILEFRKENEKIRQELAQKDNLKYSPVSFEMERKLKAQEDRIYALTQELETVKAKKDASLSVESFGYAAEVGEILREARKERQRIIDNAHIEAEQETIKLLHLRAKYKQEMKEYQSWCDRVETEKSTIQENLKQLLDQFSNADSALSSIIEKTATFDIKKIVSNVEEVENEEKGQG